MRSTMALCSRTQYVATFAGLSQRHLGRQRAPAFDGSLAIWLLDAPGAGARHRPGPPSARARFGLCSRGSSSRASPSSSLSLAAWRRRSAIWRSRRLRSGLGTSVLRIGFVGPVAHEGVQAVVVAHVLEEVLLAPAGEHQSSRCAPCDSDEVSWSRWGSGARLWCAPRCGATVPIARLWISSSAAMNRTRRPSKRVSAAVRTVHRESLTSPRW